MKNGRQWRPNYLGAIILNYCLLKMKTNYYINIAYERNLFKRKLRERIKNKEYERLLAETKKIVS